MNKLLFAVLASGCVDEQSIGSTTANNTTALFGAPRWALSIGGALDDTASSTAIAQNGDVIVAGQFQGTVDFGGSVHTGGNDFITAGRFLTRRAAADGHELWTLTQTPRQPSLDKIATAPDDTIVGIGSYLVDGEWKGVPGPVGVFQVSKRHASGAVLWSRDFDVGVSLNAVAVAPNGRIAIGGSYHTTVTLAQGSVTSDNGDGFIEVLDGDGTPLWSATMSSAHTSQPSFVYSVATTLESDVLVAGVIFEPTTFGGGVLVNNSPRTAIAARFATGGGRLYANPLGSSDFTQDPHFIAASSDGDAIVVGGEHPNAPGYLGQVPLLQRLDATGATMASHAAPDGASNIMAMTLTADQLAISAGYTSGGTIDLGAGPIAGGFFLSAQDRDGTLLDAVSVPPPTFSTAQIVGLASAGHALAAAGHIDWSIDLGTGPLRHAGGDDIAIEVYDLPGGAQ